MKAKLAPHPDFPGVAVDEIEVEADRVTDTIFRFAYWIRGPIDELVLPPDRTPARADGLWKTTCLEAFLKPDDGEVYFELNFSPSGEWAAYRFTGYREGMAPLARAPSHVLTGEEEGVYRLIAYIDLPEAEGPCRLGLSAVIEERAGAKSYWALAHPEGRPDFHHAKGFAARQVQP